MAMLAVAAGDGYAQIAALLHVSEEALRLLGKSVNVTRACWPAVKKVAWQTPKTDQVPKNVSEST